VATTKQRCYNWQDNDNATIINRLCYNMGSFQGRNYFSLSISVPIIIQTQTPNG